ncbi:hypothetical protein [Paraburkholderia sp. 32]|uniref:hypothetical protein n=1 Tax=Paraburkholderia sp. 32 TaxID=2991057 RepID=UPI003D1F2EFC
MQTCPLLRASIDARSTKNAMRRMQCVASTPSTHPSSHAERWLRIAIRLSSFMGWRALANLLAAIPDSNDDFGVFQVLSHEPRAGQAALKVPGWWQAPRRKPPPTLLSSRFTRSRRNSDPGELSRTNLRQRLRRTTD